MRQAFALIGLCSMLPLTGPASATPPLEAYGKLPMIEDAAIAPDGARVAMIVTNGEQRNVAVFTARDLKLALNVVAGNERVREIQWAGSRHIIVTVSSTSRVADVEGAKREWAVPLDVDLDARKVRPLLAGVDQGMNVILSKPMIRTVNGKPLAFIEGFYFREGLGRDSLFKFDFDTGQTTLVREGHDHTLDWLVDREGQPLAEDEFDADARKWRLRIRSGGGWSTAKLSADSIEHPVLAGLGRDGSSVLVGDSIDAKGGSTQQVLREIAPGASDWGEPFAADEDHGLIFDPATDALMGIHRLVADEDRYEFYDPTLQKYWNATVKAFPGARVSLMSMAENHKKFVVMVDSPTEAPAVSLVDIDRGSADWLGQTYDVPSADLAPTSAIAFKAADGLTLTGYLTLPKGREDRALPLVVLAHGGPAARDEPGFDWWTQAIASRGYAVLRVNFRGSGGFGWNFIAAGFGQWGRKMRTDLSDGVRYLAARGTIDPKRVAIVGASYGGYAALAGPTLEPGVYRCAVSVAGISDLKRFASWSREDADASSQRYWLRFIGVQKIGDPRLSEISPIDHVDALTAPILLIHGQDDTVVPYQQSQEMFDALRRAGKAVDLVRLAHEDHHLLMGATRLKMLRATIDFLLKNNPP